MLSRLVLVGVLLAGGMTLGDAQAAEDTCWATGWRCDTVNAYRADHGLPPLDQAATLQQSAGAWARRMAATGVLAHSGATTPGLGEVVCESTDWRSCLTLWDESPHHRAILLDPDARRVGIGVARDTDGRVWAAVQTL